MFDRRTGMNIVIDEVTVDRAQWSAAPRQVSIALTNACDLACRFCYAPKYHSVASLDSVSAWVEELDAGGCLGVGFGGGEPTLYRDLPRLCRRACERTNLAISLTTHAHRFTPRLIGELDGVVHFIRVSVDGTGVTYERIRGRSYDDLCGKLELIAASFPTGVNCVVNEATIGELDAVADLAASSGAVELLLLPQLAAGGLPGADPSVIAQMLDWVNLYIAGRGSLMITVAAGLTGDVRVADPLPGELGLRSYAHVDATGTLRPTSFSDHGVAIGDRGFLAALAELAESIEPFEGGFK